MNCLVSYLSELNQIEYFKKLNSSTECLISIESFSRKALLSVQQAMHLASHAFENELPCILEWDILMTENDFSKSTQVFQKIDLSLFKAIRVQDIGALNWCLKHTNLPIQLNLEVAHHNLDSILTWIKSTNDRIERVILSIELPFNTLKQWITKIPVPCEILTLGPNLIFYTPRKLLSALEGSLAQSSIKMLATSEESPHKGFKLVENKHGVFMYHVKDFCIIDNIEDLIGIGINHFRCDIEGKDYQILSLIDQYIIDPMTYDLNLKLIIDLYSEDVHKGFFKANKTDVLFPKLKNNRLMRNDQKFVGEVLEIIKNKAVLIEIKSSVNLLKLNQMIEIITPEGKRFESLVNNMRNSLGEEIKETHQDQLVWIDMPYKIVAKSIVNLLAN